MRENKVKRSLAGGGVALGTMVMEFSTTGVARLAAEAGADFAVFDLEHTGWGMDTVRTLLTTARPANLVPVVRVPAAQYPFIARVLDLGAMGIMVPMVEGAEQARDIVRFAKYPPQGRRGAAFGVAHDDYTSGDIVAKMRSANDEGLLIAQIETVGGLEDVEGIAAVPGIDVLWIGHFDLTNSMGIPGEFGHTRYQEALERVLAACRRHGKAAGFMASSVEEGRWYLARGFRCLAYWGDLWIYREGLRQGLAGLRGSGG
jgi:2-dehydro-3-deoxyglucarate aldolase/4-hydroxy-2-oxoheptanedioate aldolase